MFADVPGTVVPTDPNQWFPYRFTVQVANRSVGAVVLSPETWLALGPGTQHEYRAALAAETPVLPGATVALAFSRVRVCGHLPAGPYTPALGLRGTDDAGRPFAQDLDAVDNPVTVVAQPEDHLSGGQLSGPIGVYDFVCTPTGAVLAYRLTPANRYPVDVELGFIHPPRHFDILLPDGTPAEGYVFEGLVGETALPLLHRPAAGLEHGRLYSEGRVLNFVTLPVACPHGGIGVGAALPMSVLGAVDTDARPRLAAVVVPPQARPGERIDVVATAENPKGYGIYVDTVTEATRVRATRDGQDASHLFTTEGVIGPYLPGERATAVTYWMRVRADAPAGDYDLIPVLRTTRASRSTARTGSS